MRGQQSESVAISQGTTGVGLMMDAMRCDAVISSIASFTGKNSLGGVESLFLNTRTSIFKIALRTQPICNEQKI
jgi:hypothetical protein